MLGLSSFVYRWAIGRSYYRPENPMTPVQFMNAAVHHGVGAVMFCHNFPFETYTRDEVQALSRASRQAGLQVEMGARGSAPDYFNTMLEISDCMGAGILRLTLDVDRADKAGIPQELQRIRACLERILPVARKYGISLAVENYIDLPSPEIVDIVEYFHDPLVRVCYDSANSILGFENPVETARLLAPYTSTAHFKDVKTVLNPRGNIIQGTALGDGMVDLPGILQVLRRDGFQGCIHLELYIDRKDDPLETLVWEEMCVEKSVIYARQVLGL